MKYTLKPDEKIIQIHHVFKKSVHLSIGFGKVDKNVCFIFTLCKILN